MRLARSLSTDLFSVRELVLISIAFPVAVIVSNVIMNAINFFAFDGRADIPIAWPISVFGIHVGWQNMCTTVPSGLEFSCLPLTTYVATILLCVLVFVSSAYYVIESESGIVPVILFGLLLLFGTNLIQGYRGGFAIPVAGGTLQYYHDAIHVTEPVEFLSTYESLQPELQTHSQTHPPGAVLVFVLLNELLGLPGLISISIAVPSIAISSYYLYRILRMRYDAHLSQYVCYLFVLLPSVQIYYLASLDALIAALLTGSLYYFVQDESRWLRVFGTASLLVLSSFLTFSTLLFVTPLLVGYSLLTDTRWMDLVVVLTAVGLTYVLVYLGFGYNYVNSFFIASSVENPDGFRLLTQTADYVFTRVEGVVEILVFFTPYLTVLLYRKAKDVSVRDVFTDEFTTLTTLGVLVLLGMFGAGVFRTGETARAAIFIYPFLMLMIAAYFRSVSLSRRAEYVLASLVFLQTFMMQIVGFYFW